MDADLGRALRADLEALPFENLYQVDALLSNSTAGRTELVHDANGTLFVRKYLQREEEDFNPYALLVNVGSDFFPRVSVIYELSNAHVVVMEYCPGHNLQELVERQGPYSQRASLILLIRTAQGIAELHKLIPPLIHRDIKPSNILLLPQPPPAAGVTRPAEPVIKIIDLGIARTFKPDKTNDTYYRGTRGYAAPEQFGYGQTSVRTDIYALGATLYFLATGKRFDPTVRDRLGGSPLAVIVKRCTEFSPDNRFQSVKELLAALKVALGIVESGLSVPGAGQVSSRVPRPSNGGSLPVQPNPVQAVRPPLNSGRAPVAAGGFASPLHLIWRIPLGTVLVLLSLASFLVPFDDQMWYFHHYGFGVFFLRLTVFWLLAFLVFLPVLVLVVNPFNLRARIRWLRTDTVPKIVTTLICLFIAYMVIGVVAYLLQPAIFASP